jgi:acetolactate synthase-like protein
MVHNAHIHGGQIVADVLKVNKVKVVFTLTGGHISPILIGCQNNDIDVIDVRHEANAVFAADAVSRLSTSLGVAIVTAGPGVTNTVTALKNAQMAESPLILIGGAPPTILEGRGALQDIDQINLVKTVVKGSFAISKVKDIEPKLSKAIEMALSGVRGPVFVQLPIDTLYPEETVRTGYGIKKDPKGFMNKFMNWYVKRSANKVLFGLTDNIIPVEVKPKNFEVNDTTIFKALGLLQSASKPVFLLGSQIINSSESLTDLKDALESLNIPLFLSGMARGLLGKDHNLQFRHKRSYALKNADLVILFGVPLDFRLDYGRHISRKSYLISINRNKFLLKQNRIFRKIQLQIHSDPKDFLLKLSEYKRSKNILFPNLKPWFDELKKVNSERDAEIDKLAEEEPVENINPLAAAKIIDNYLTEKSVLIGDGGDWIATLSYIIQPRGGLKWLDPGVFGTLGSGGGFALASKYINPDNTVWLFYGDGSSLYSVMELDTMKRHNLPIIMIIGNDAAWAQIAREQVEIFANELATRLEHTDYHLIAEAFQSVGIIVKQISELDGALQKAIEINKQGQSVIINLVLSKSDFRKGSISM